MKIEKRNIQKSTHVNATTAANLTKLKEQGISLADKIEWGASKYLVDFPPNLANTPQPHPTTPQRTPEYTP